MQPMASEEWTTTDYVEHYLARADEHPRRTEGESVRLELVPRDFRRVLGRRTPTRFAGDERLEAVEHNLETPLPALGRFDAVVSSMAIHHLEHDRKRSLYAEVFDLLEPGAVFANFEHVAAPTHRVHLAFYEAIGEPLECEDPSDRLLDVETQLTWLREIAALALGQMLIGTIVSLAS